MKVEKILILVLGMLMIFTITYSQKYSGNVSAQKNELTAPQTTPQPIPFDPYADLNVRLGEKLQENEVEVTKKIAVAMKAQVQKARENGEFDEKSKPVLSRAVHPKAHCCIKAEFTVGNDIPKDLRVGLFAKKAAFYTAWIRYSNSNAKMRDDKTADARGMAIKLTQVAGIKIDPSLPEQSTQDFVLLSGPTFVVDDPMTYLKVFTEGPQSLPAENLKFAGILSGSHQKSLLQEVYWSQTPYRLLLTR